MEQSKQKGGEQSPPNHPIDGKRTASNTRIVTEEEIAEARTKIGISASYDGYTLCDMMRQIYYIADSLDDARRAAIQRRCLVAFCYAKKMDKKLGYYKKKEFNG